MNKLLVLFALIPIISGCHSPSRSEDKQERSGPRHSPPKSVAKLAFPIIDGWQQTAIKIAGEDDAEGYAIGYRSSQGMLVTIALYRLKNSQANVLDFQVVQQEMNEIRQSLRDLKQTDIYRATELAVETIALDSSPPPLQALRSMFLLDTTYGYAISDIYLTVYHDYLVKIQCNRPLNLDDFEIESIESLLSSIGQLLSRS